MTLTDEEMAAAFRRHTDQAFQRPQRNPMTRLIEMLRACDAEEIGTPAYMRLAQVAFEYANEALASGTVPQRDRLMMADAVASLARYLSIDWALTAAGGPDQARAPKGTRIGGQWIDTPSAMIRNLRELGQKSLMDQTEEERALHAQTRKDLADYLKTSLENQVYGDGFTVKVDPNVTGRSVSFMGAVIDKNNELVGSFARRVVQDRDGLYVHHDLLRIKPEAQGRGFSTDFHQRSEEMYREMGLDGIRLTAAMEAGGYVWARAGYEWDTNPDYAVTPTFDEATMGKMLANYQRFGQDDDYDRLIGLADMAAESPESLPSPYEIAGMYDSNGGHVGKAILTGSVWTGVKRFDQPEDVAIAASGYEESLALFEFCRRNGLDYDQEWPDLVERTWWSERGLTASGSYNPAQARAPKGSSIGGQWIMTPGGLLVSALTGKPAREALALNRPDAGPTLTSNPWISGLYSNPSPVFSAMEDMKVLAETTRAALAEAASQPVRVSVDKSVLADILETGRMMNVHETGGKYEHYREQRRKYEREIMGVPEGRKDSDYPIYGWATRKDEGATYGYGSVDITLKPEVNQRTTYTVGDSMNQQIVPTWGDEIAGASMVEMLSRSQWAVDYYDKSALPDWREGPFSSRIWANYVEAQVHGGVTLADIESVTVPNFSTLKAETLNGLAAAGIEVIFQSTATSDDEQAMRDFVLERFPDGPPDFLPAAAKWYPEAVTAGGGPDQARAPKGTPIGGQWIITPGGIIQRLPREDVQGTLDLGDDMQMRQDYFLPNRSPIHPLVPALDGTPKGAEVATILRQRLSQAAATPLTIFMSRNAIRGVLTEGRIKNVHETNSRSEVYVEQRDLYERDVMGVRDPRIDVERFDPVGGDFYGEDWIEPDMRPVYGAVGWNHDLAMMNGYYYGNHEVILKPEVLDRATVTLGDSMDNDAFPLWVSEIADAPDETILQAAAHLAANTGAYDDPNMLVDRWMEEFVPYVETQVHGGVTLADVAEIRIPSASAVAQFSPEEIQAIVGGGVKVVDQDGNDLSEDIDAARYHYNIPPALTASGNYNPGQARAPKGTDIGGQWIDTPSGLLPQVDALDGRGHPRKYGLARQSVEDYMNTLYAQAWGALPEEAQAELAEMTREALQEAVAEGVHIRLGLEALEEMAGDGHFKPIGSLAAEGENIKGTPYLMARMGYESSVMGVPQDRGADARPVYGYGKGDDYGSVGMYGNIEVKLRDDVLPRTTWTVDDSLDFQERPLWSDEIDTASTEELLATSHWAIETTMPVRVKEWWGDGPWGNEVSYIEAQVHGGITLDDIEYVNVPSISELSAETILALENAGVEIIEGLVW